MLSFLGKPRLPVAPSLQNSYLIPVTGLQSVYHAAILGDINLIQLWTNSGERMRVDEKHAVTGPPPAPLKRTAC